MAYSRAASQLIPTEVSPTRRGLKQKSGFRCRQSISEFALAHFLTWCELPVLEANDLGIPVNQSRQRLAYAGFFARRTGKLSRTFRDVHSPRKE